MENEQSSKRNRYKNCTYYFLNDIINIKNFDPNLKPLYLTIDKIPRSIEESYGNKWLTLILTDESKDILKKFEELQNKIRDFIRSITSNSVNYDEKYIKIKFSSDDDYLSRKS